MSHCEIIALLKSKHLKINEHGTIQHHPLIPPYNYDIYYIMLIYTNIIHIHTYIKNIKIIPVTLYSSTHYASFIEQLLIVNKIDYYKIFKPYMTDNHYTLSDQSKAVSINPSLHHFTDSVITFTPLNTDEITILQVHTQLENLHDMQKQVLSMLPDINAAHIVKHHWFIPDEDDYHYTYNHIKSITMFGNLYRIETNDSNNHKIFYTQYILTDKIEPLESADIVNKSYFDTSTNTLLYDAKYIVNDVLMLEPLRKKLMEDDIVSLPFYNLKTPRDRLVLHPFHYPGNSDVILTLLVVAQAIISHYIIQ